MGDLRPKLLMGLLLLLGGCDSQSTVTIPTPDPEVPSVEVDGSATIGTESDEIDIRLIDAAEFAKEMESRHGKVVLLDMWATW